MLAPASISVPVFPPLLMAGESSGLLSFGLETAPTTSVTLTPVSAWLRFQPASLVFTHANGLSAQSTRATALANAPSNPYVQIGFALSGPDAGTFIQPSNTTISILRQGEPCCSRLM